MTKHSSILPDRYQNGVDPNVCNAFHDMKKMNNVRHFGKGHNIPCIYQSVMRASPRLAYSRVIMYDKRRRECVCDSFMFRKVSDDTEMSWKMYCSSGKLMLE